MFCDMLLVVVVRIERKKEMKKIEMRKVGKRYQLWGGAVCRRVGGGVDTEEKRRIISTVGTCQHLVVVGGDYCYYSLDYYLDPMGQHFDNDDFGGDCRVDKVFVVLVVVDFGFDFDTWRSSSRIVIYDVQHITAWWVHFSCWKYGCIRGGEIMLYGVVVVVGTPFSTCVFCFIPLNLYVAYYPMAYHYAYHRGASCC